MSEPKFPNVTVTLSGHDGNAFAILGTVKKAMHHANVSQESIDEFLKEAKSSDYDHLLQTCFKYVNVE
jgi:hypothetical protein